MVAVNPKLELKLDPARLAAIIDSTVVTSSEIVNFHFNALSTANLEGPAEPAEQLYRFKGPQLTGLQRREIHENWILAKAFQELLRAVRLALEEAHIYVSLLTKIHKVRSNATLLDFLRPFQRKAAGLKFPELLSAVNDKLNPKLDFADSYRSLQSARNCLEHRNGIVTSVDTHGNKVFRLSMPRMKPFYMRQGAEVEIVTGHRVEPGDDRREVDVLMRLDVRERSVPLGERLVFTLAEFNEIAFACHFLGQQLSSRLPRPSIAEA
jgi:predicted KAP-like P-loop ATPase